MNYARTLAGDDVLIDGYSWSEDGTSVSNLPLDESELSKIALTLTDCDIEIATSKDKSYVELINFKPNTYICSTSSKSLTVSDDISITDYLSFDGSGVKFSGVWQTLFSEYNSRKYSSSAVTRKTVVIYLNSTDALKQINLELNNCKLRLHDISGSGDIKINATDSQAELTNISSTVLVLDGADTEYSLLNINTSKLTSALESGDFTANELSVGSMSFEMGELDMSLKLKEFSSLELELVKGNVKLETVYDMTCFARDLETKNGNLIINGTNSGSSFKSNKDTVYPASISAEIKEGDIDITFGNQIILVNPDTNGKDPDADPDSQPSTQP